MLASGQAMRSTSAVLGAWWSLFLHLLEDALTSDLPRFTGDPEVDRLIMEAYLKARDM